MRTLLNFFAYRAAERRPEDAKNPSSALPGGVSIGPWSVVCHAVAGAPRHDLVGAGAFVAEGQELIEPGCTQDWATGASTRWPERLSGDVTYAHVWADGSCVAARSIAGVVPLYYWQGPDNQVAIGTLLSDFVRYRVVPAELDREAVALHLSSLVHYQSRAAVRGVRILAPGTALTIDRGCTLKIRRYWAMDAMVCNPPTRAEFAAASYRLRRQFVSYCDKAFPASGTLVTFSGGVDSSVIACVATGALGRHILTLTVFAPGAAGEHDRIFVDSVVAARGRNIDRRFEETFDVTASLRHLRTNPPAVVFSSDGLPGFVREQNEAGAGIAACAGGEFADGLFGAANSFDEWMRALRWSQVLSRPGLGILVARHPRAFHRVVSGRFRGRLPVMWLATPLLTDSLRGLDQEFRSSWERRAATHWRGPLALRFERAAAFKAMRWEYLSPLGVSPVYPFHNREMVELALSTHPAQHAGLGGGKRLIRDAFVGLVPPKNLTRPDKGQGAGMPGRVSWSEPLPGALAGLVREDWFPRPPERISFNSALQLQGLLNMVAALGNC